MAKKSTKRVVKAAQPKAKKVKPVVDSKSSRRPEVSEELPFSRKNYIFLGIGILMIAFGFILMAQDEFIDATKFSVSLYIAPIIVVAGFVEVIWAIMYKDKVGTPKVNDLET